jgi:hypothetical protein
MIFELNGGVERHATYEVFHYSNPYANPSYSFRLRTIDGGCRGGWVSSRCGTAGQHRPVEFISFLDVNPISDNFAIDRCLGRARLESRTLTAVSVFEGSRQRKLCPRRLFPFVIRVKPEQSQQVGSASPTAGNMCRAHDPENRVSGESSRPTPRNGCKLPVSPKGDALEEYSESLAPNGQRLPAVKGQGKLCFHQISSCLFMQYFPIEYPEKDSEFEVQASLWMALKAEGFIVKGEVESVCYDFTAYHRVSFDLVVFNELKAPIVIIECKNWISDCEQLKGRQARRYAMFGVPVLLCTKLANVPKVVKAVLALEQSILEEAHES